MRKMRGIIALLASLVLAGLVSYAVYGYLSRPAPKPAPPAAETKNEPTPVVPRTVSHRIASGMRAMTIEVDDVSGGSRDLAAGDRVDILAVTPVPEYPEGRVSHPLLTGVTVMAVGAGHAAGGRAEKKWTVTLAVPPENAIGLSSADPAAKLRLVIRNPEDQDTVTGNAVAFTPADGIQAYTKQKRDLDALIAPGLRAFTLTVGPTDGVGGVFQPGDRVDIVVTSVWGNVALESQDKPGETGVLKETHRNSRILMQNIGIIATDRSLAWEAGANRSAEKIILAVTPQEAEQLTVLADSKNGGNLIRLIARNSNDHRRVHTRGAELLDLISNKRPYQRVDMIRGPLRKDQTFYKPVGNR